MAGSPAAFMSYVRFNDQHDDGQLTQFRDRLATEVRAQTGGEFAIFQDRNDIAWGQHWQQRIDEALDAVTLLLVIITPSLFRSPACRDEITRFLERERALGRADLILPVYYIGAREMDDPGLREGDELAQVLWSRQYADWRELRFEPFTSPAVRKALAQLAARIRQVTWQPLATAPGSGQEQIPGSAARASYRSAAEAVTTKVEPPTHVVDVFPGRGDFATVGAAIAAARPGDRILVRPGLYEEGLVVDKPLEILGDGSAADIEIRARGAAALLFRASIGRVANLTLRQTGGKGRWFGVDIAQGRLDLEDCDISSQSSACVAIRDGADPRLRRNRIHNGKMSAVSVSGSALGTLEDNDIAACGRAGVEIRTGGNPTLRRNQIHNNKEAGFLVSDNGLGTLEDNDITGNSFSGVEIQAESDPTVRHNQIRHNGQNGVFVHNGGLGTLEDNDVTANLRAGIEIRSGGNPKVIQNRINRNGYQAVWIHEGGRGMIENNDLRGNTGGVWDIAEDCESNVTRVGNAE
jgi:F-box protein 11